MKIIGPIFEFKEYSFVDTPTKSTSQFRNKIELLEKYKEAKDMTSEETLKLYAEVINISSQYMSLIVVRDQACNTLNLQLGTNNKVSKMKMDPKDIPLLDMIHLHK